MQAALALHGGLRVHARDPQAERAAERALYLPVYSDLTERAFEHLGVPFADEDHDYPRAAPDYGIGGWMRDDSAVLLYDIPRVVVGENRTFQGPEEYLRARGVELEIVDSAECVQLISDFIRDNPQLWNEDIGE